MPHTVSLKVTGKIFTINKEKILEQIIGKLSESIKQYIHNTFKRNIELMSYVNIRPDKEAVDAILRSLNVKIKSINPVVFSANFEDIYGHWYGGQKLPDEMAEMIKNILDEAIKNWTRSDESKLIIKDILG